MPMRSVAEAMGAKPDGTAAVVGAYERLVRQSGIKISLAGDGLELNRPELLAERMASPANMPMRANTVRDVSDADLLMLAERVLSLRCANLMNGETQIAARWLIEEISRELHGRIASEGVKEVLARLGAQALDNQAFAAPAPRRLPACRYFPETAAAAMLVSPVARGGTCLLRRAPALEAESQLFRRGAGTGLHGQLRLCRADRAGWLLCGR